MILLPKSASTGNPIGQASFQNRAFYHVSPFEFQPVSLLDVRGHPWVEVFELCGSPFGVARCVNMLSTLCQNNQPSREDKTVPLVFYATHPLHSLYPATTPSIYSFFTPSVIVPSLYSPVITYAFRTQNYHLPIHSHHSPDAPYGHCSSDVLRTATICSPSFRRLCPPHQRALRGATAVW